MADRSGAGEGGAPGARAARAGWTVLAAAPGLLSAFLGGRSAWLAAGATALLAGAAALRPRPDGRRRTSPGPRPPAAAAGVLTREAFLERVEADVAGGAVEFGLLGVFRLADADRLTAFDAASGALALHRLEARLREAVDAASPVARLRHGGFAVWIPSADDADGGEARLQAVARALSAPGGDHPTPAVSAAAVAYPRDGRDAAALLRCADALLAGRGASAGEVATASSPAAVAARERFSLTQELRGAVRRDELHLQFQPVVDAIDGRVAGAEALLRWTSGARGPVAPDAFVPLLEDSGLIDEVGLWTLDAACRQLGVWKEGALAGVRVAVNVSAHQFRDPGLPRLIAHTLERHGVAPSRLEVELTETAALEDEARTRRLMDELHELGVGVALDDFGSGWSSMRYLKNLPVSKLKIDREFVTEVDRRPDSRAICRSLVELGRGLGMTVLAEGVERPRGGGGAAGHGVPPPAGLLVLPAAGRRRLRRPRARAGLALAGARGRRGRRAAGRGRHGVTPGARRSKRLG